MNSTVVKFFRLIRLGMHVIHFVYRCLKNVFHFLSITAHGLMLSNPLSEYTNNLARISGVCILLMSCISEQGERVK